MVAAVDGVVEVCEGPAGLRVVEPVGDGVDEEAARSGAAGGCGPHLPVGLGVAVAAVEGDAEDLAVLRVPGGLHGVDVLRDDAEVEEEVWVDVVQETPGGAVFVGEEGVASGGVDGEVL